MIKKIFSLSLITALSTFSTNSSAAEVSSTMYLATNEGQGKEIGIVIFTDTPNGLRVLYELTNLTPGNHGFHVHENPDCSPVVQDGHSNHAMAAGGHYDPEKTEKHLGPDGLGHRGDLPVLNVDSEGRAMGEFTFGKEKDLRAEEFRNRALMIHEGGDNYSDTPVALGGGGARIACGIIN